jgi:hypothetical protein
VLGSIVWGGGALCSHQAKVPRALGERGGRRGRGGGDWWRRSRAGSRITGEGSREHEGAPEGEEGPHRPERGATELVDVASVPTPEAASVMLVSKDEELLSQMAASILEINEAGSSIR